jgi:hypothetical protein
MNRNEFLKYACKYGLCGCVGMSFLTGNVTLANAENSGDNDEPDWRIDFMQSRFKNLIDILDDSLDDDTLIPVLNQLGAKCGDDFAIRYKENPQGFFDFMKSLWADTVDYDEKQGIIKVNEKVRETCNCPFVKKKEARAILFNQYLLRLFVTNKQIKALHHFKLCE